MKTKILILTFIFLSQFGYGQQIITDEIIVDTVQTDSINNLTLKEKSPIKASLYSAVLPGAGQLYNNKWWKAPIALGLVGTGIGFTAYYNGLQNKFRSAYIAEL